MGNTNYNHITASTIRKKIGNRLYDSKIQFCFIRNPIDLVKSWYYYHKYSPNVKRQDVKDFYPNTIDDWVINMKCKTHWETTEHKRFNADWNIHQSPLFQHKWIMDDNNNMIVQNIFIFDNLEHEIEKMFGVKPKKENSSNKDTYSLNPATENLIIDMFQTDISLYNHLCKDYQRKEEESKSSKTI